MMKMVAVIIPIYRDYLTKNEAISLEQVSKVLAKYDMYFVMPETLRINYSREYIKEVRFADCEFRDIKSYSDFMLKVDVYEKFLDYDYVLVYQLDAFVFEDKLNFFCKLGYDYIGAPTLEGMFKFYRNEPVLFTQNGGFSLRRVKTFIKWIKENYDEIQLMKEFDLEDSIIYALRNKGLNYAPVDKALEFSFDSNVEECFRQTNGRIPFGCHAWERYAYEIWKPYIEKFGYGSAVVEPSRRIVKDYYNIANYNYKWLKRFDAVKFRETVCKNISRFQNKVYVFGMGKLGYDAMQLLLGAGIEVVSYVDNNPEVVSRGMYPINAICGEDFFEMKNGIPVIVAIYHHVDVCIKLEENGYRHRMDYATFAEIYCDFESEIMKQ